MFGNSSKYDLSPTNSVSTCLDSIFILGTIVRNFGDLWRDLHTTYTVKAGYNEFDGTRENIPYNQKFLITKVTFIVKIIIIYN